MGWAVEELDAVFGFIYARVGNRSDAEDLTQQVAVKALPRLRAGAPPPEVRGYLYACARSVLADFWARRLRIPQVELPLNLWVESRPQATEPRDEPSELLAGILACLSPDYRRLLELRFLRGYKLSEVAAEMGKTVGAVKLMQLRALRKAAVSVLGPEPAMRQETPSALMFHSLSRRSSPSRITSKPVSNASSAL